LMSISDNFKIVIKQRLYMVSKKKSDNPTEKNC
jgi:hypothetical protein